MTTDCIYNRNNDEVDQCNSVCLYMSIHYVRLQSTSITKYYMCVTRFSVSSLKSLKSSQPYCMHIVHFVFKNNAHTSTQCVKREKQELAIVYALYKRYLNQIDIRHFQTLYRIALQKAKKTKQPQPVLEIYFAR